MTNNRLLKTNLTGLQHLGIPVTDLLDSAAFYERFGFERVMSAQVAQERQAPVQVAMMKFGNVLIELYQLSGEAWKELASRADGHVDHIALNVKNVDEAFREIRAAGIATIEDDPVFLNFWERGCKYFTIRGPDGEKLEFNQIL